MTATAILYKTVPNYERQAAREIERQGINAIVPWDESGKRVRVTAPGYVFAGKAVSTAYTKHVRHRMGHVSLADIAGLYVRKPEPKTETNPFSIGQCVVIGELTGVVAGTVGANCTVVLELLGKQHAKVLHYSRLRPG